MNQFVHKKFSNQCNFSSCQISIDVQVIFPLFQSDFFFVVSNFFFSDKVTIGADSWRRKLWLMRN